jgi:hypothetical protein
MLSLCPHCGIMIEIVQLNCAIFRCGIYKHNYQQIPPHLPKRECDLLIDKIYGCGKPFRVINKKLEICDYI